MLSRFCTWLLNTLGWTIIPDFPDTEKFVIIAAPHTSNWDFPLGIVAAKALKLEPHWIGKHTLFRWPFGWFFRALGGIPVDRREKRDLIRALTELFANSEKLVLALAPEGTRSKTDHWKTGFYHIARAASVPIVMAFLDFGNKQVGTGGSFYPGDDIEKDFILIRDFYKNRRGKNPDNESWIGSRVKKTDG